MALYRHDDPCGEVGCTRGSVSDHQAQPLVRPYNGSGPDIVKELNVNDHTATDGVGSISTRMSGTGPEG